MIIGASPTTVSASQVQGGAPVTANITLTNSGNTSGTWTKTKTYTSGTGWLTITPGTGVLSGGGGTQTLTITCTPGTLTPGAYTGYFTFTLGTSTAVVNVTFTITAPTSGATISASPALLAFGDIRGATN